MTGITRKIGHNRGERQSLALFIAYANYFKTNALLTSSLEFADSLKTYTPVLLLTIGTANELAFLAPWNTVLTSAPLISYIARSTEVLLADEGTVMKTSFKPETLLFLKIKRARSVMSI
jgi:hypothetical protein